MRTIAICLTICLVSFLAFTEYRRTEERKIAAAEALVKAMADASADAEKARQEQPRTLPVASTSQRTYVPGLGRYIEHDRSTSAMQSIGGGAGSSPWPTPAPATAAEIKKSFGFGPTALDPKR